MKSNSKFFLGLALGLSFGFVAFNIGNANSTNTEATPPSANEVANESINGKLISTGDAAALEANYVQFMQQKAGQTEVCLGGVIGQSELKNLLKAFPGSSTIAYRFYKTAASPETEAKIGLIFYKNSTDANALRSGDAAFCPTMCTKD